MPDTEQTSQTLDYATPSTPQQTWLSGLAIASVVIATLSTAFAALMCFREGLTNTQAREQMMIGRVGGIVGDALALGLALVSYRRVSAYALSNVAVGLSVVSILYILIKLPPW